MALASLLQRRQAVDPKRDRQDPPGNDSVDEAEGGLPSAPAEAYELLVQLAESTAAADARVTVKRRRKAQAPVCISANADTDAQQAQPVVAAAPEPAQEAGASRPVTRAAAAKAAAQPHCADAQLEGTTAGYVKDLSRSAQASGGRYHAHFDATLSSEDIAALSAPCKAQPLPTVGGWQHADVRKHAHIAVHAPLHTLEPLAAPLALSAHGAY